jgi:hypothetical protein
MAAVERRAATSPVTTAAARIPERLNLTSAIVDEAKIGF